MNETNETNETINSIVARAKANAEERKQLITDTMNIIETFGLDEELDRKFLKKLYHFPGDITTHRIAKELEKAL